MLRHPKYAEQINLFVQFAERRLESAAFRSAMQLQCMKTMPDVQRVRGGSDAFRTEAEKVWMANAQKATADNILPYLILEKAELSGPEIIKGMTSL